MTILDKKRQRVSAPDPPGHKTVLYDIVGKVGHSLREWLCKVGHSLRE